MRVRPWILAMALVGRWCVAGPEVQAAPVPLPPVPGPNVPAEDPFLLPPEAELFVAHALDGVPSQDLGLKLQALLDVLFSAPQAGGMGLTYDNARTRTVAEVWREHKANCLSMTAFFVAASRSLGIRTDYAEAVNTSHWRRVGPLIQYERHVVAVARNELVADFLPTLHKRAGRYAVVTLAEKHFRSLYYSNLAVEALTVGSLEEALALARTALDTDPSCGVGWNLLGVVQEAQAQPGLAEQAFLRALALDPGDGTPVGNLERLLREAGRVREAEKYRKLGEEVRRKDPYFHANLAEEALEAGDLPEAQRRIGLAQGLQPQEPEFFLLEGRLRVAQGQWDQAIKAIRKARQNSSPAQQARLDDQLARIEAMRPGGKMEL